jgi:hypothetical protein
MTDLDPAVHDLTAGEHREALTLILAELRDLPNDGGEELYRRLGALRAQVETLAGESRYGLPPIYGLRGLRRSQAEGAGE